MQGIGKEFKTESVVGGGGGAFTSNSTKTNPKDVEQVNLAQMAGGKNGSLEIQKYLYETGLQNIFNDYNKQIANLDDSKRKEIEDAYYVRELSKKYLGEYASNAGIGDVSGQLLDIYGNYQSNMNEINANFNELQTGLESSYNENKNAYELGLLQTQMDIENVEQQEQLEKELAEINYNLSLELYPEGMDAQDYIDSVRDKIGESNYWSLMTQHKLVEMSNTVTNALSKTNDYKNQGEWDTFVDSLFSNKSINKQQSDYLKGMYEIEQNTNFVKNNNINIDSDISYYNPNNFNIVPKGNVYESRGGDLILAETTKVVDSSSNLYEIIDEKGKEKPFDTPFAHDGKWFVKTFTNNGEQIYTEYVKSNSYNKMTYSSVISGSNQSQKENYEQLNKLLGDKGGNISTPNGTISYTYDKEKDEYKPYINFQANKQNININGIEYKGNKQINYKNKELVKGLWKELADAYFNGDVKESEKYIKEIAKGKYQDSNTLVIEYNKRYYAVNDGGFIPLNKK